MVTKGVDITTIIIELSVATNDDALYTQMRNNKEVACAELEIMEAMIKWRSALNTLLCSERVDICSIVNFNSSGGIT